MSARARLAAAAAASLLALALAGGPASGAGPGSPNFVVILTDDQTSYEFDAMPQTQALIRAQGTNFSRFYASYPICCPSRATLLTGQYMHNHQVRGNLAPFGGAGRFRSLGVEARSLPTWLKAAGYNTAHVGKYLNGWPDDGIPYVPPGWDEWYGQISDFDSSQVGGKLYYNYDLLEKQLGGGAATLNHYGFDVADYQTDVLQGKALGALDRLGDEGLLGSDQPFYLEFAPHAPHFPFEPPPRYKGTMSAAALPPLVGINEEKTGDKPRYLREQSRINANTLAQLGAARRARLEMLRGVDDAVAAIVAKLAEEGELDNTYVMFVADNGYFFGEHRIVSGKYLPYEPASRVPFAIRGPGIPAGAISGELSANIDVAPTIASLAGAPPPTGVTMDGRSLLPFAANPGARSRRPLLLEGDIGPGIGPSDLAPRSGVGWAGRLGLPALRGVPDLEAEVAPRRAALNGDAGPAYRAIRTNRYVLILYPTNEVELYDMTRDPAQLVSLRKNRRYKRVRRVLLKRLAKLSNCQAGSCQTSYGKDPKPKRKRKRRKSKK